MTNPNRSRITIEVPGRPGLYQPFPLPDWEVIGVISRGRGGSGALVRHTKTKVYAQANAGAVSLVPTHKVEAALAKLEKQR